jgi:S-DNA-T family DNA segregation ATPase FtsK/SpoIIIE
LDTIGAEHLLGAGDMLFLPPGSSKLIRIHGAFVSGAEIKRVVEFLKKQGKPSYDSSILLEVKKEKEAAGEEEYDEKYDEAVAFVAEAEQASISLIQRRFRIGYNRAARIIEKMEKEGVVGSSDGVKPREVLIKKIE